MFTTGTPRKPQALKPRAHRTLPVCKPLSTLRSVLRTRGRSFSEHNPPVMHDTFAAAVAAAKVDARYSFRRPKKVHPNGQVTAEFKIMRSADDQFIALPADPKILESIDPHSTLINVGLFIRKQGLWPDMRGRLAFWNGEWDGCWFKTRIANA